MGTRGMPADASSGVLVIAIWLIVMFANTHASPTRDNEKPVMKVRSILGWENETASAEFRIQMVNPSDIFSVLLIIGGDIVQKAIAQMCGRHVTLVAFSFGWVAYAFTAVLSAFGDGSLMPDPDCPSVVITVSSRNKRINNSWVIGRLIRDLERDVEKSLRPSELNTGLLVTFYEALDGTKRPVADVETYSFFVCLLLQLAMGVVPTVLYGNWSIIFVTAVGTILAVTSASLREWRLEKYQGRGKSKDDYAVTRGNGHKHVFIIKTGDACRGHHLDDLAGAVKKSDLWTRSWTVILATLWIAFLLMAAGLQNNSWFLVGVGLIGMAQNVFVAGRPRTSAAHGLPLRRLPNTYGRNLGTERPKVMRILEQLEWDHRGTGLAIRQEFMADHSLRADEIAWWNNPTDPSQALEAQVVTAK